MHNVIRSFYYWCKTVIAKDHFFVFIPNVFKPGSYKNKSRVVLYPMSELGLNLVCGTIPMTHRVRKIKVYKGSDILPYNVDITGAI